jgi:ElaB/YqjD/DUF883 family membrane-anchored ribosome-binding protein
VPGLGFARDTTDAREITKDRANLEELRRDTDDLLRMTSSFAGRAVPGEAKAKIAALANKVKIKAKDVAKLGVMSDSDSRLLDAMMGDPTSAVRVDGLAGLRQFRAGVDRSDDLLRSHYGVTPGRVAVIDTPKGQRRVGVYTGQPTEPRGAVRFTPSAGGGPK